MANQIPPKPDFGDSDLINYVVRMVIPMRREFSQSLNVSHFLHDFAYARQILDQARESQDARLRENARYVEGKLFGPRNAGQAPSASSESAYVTTAASPLEPEGPPAPAGPAPEQAPAVEMSEAEMRARMMAKYRSGLR